MARQPIVLKEHVLMKGSHYEKYSGGHFLSEWELEVRVGEWFASTREPGKS